MGGGEIEALTRRAFELWNAREYDDLLKLFEKDATWDMRPIEVPGMHEYKGHRAIRRFFDQWLEVFPDATVEVESVEQRGDWGFATVVQSVHGSSSGAPATFTYYGIGHWRAGQLSFVENYVNRDRAWQAFRIYTEAPSPRHEPVA